MRLFGLPYSPLVAKVRKCLELKRVPFEMVIVQYLDRRELAAVTGGSVQVPALVDEERKTVVAKNDRVTSYLDEWYAPSLRTNPLAVVIESWADGVFQDVAFRIATPGLESRIADLNGGRDDARAMFRDAKERKYGAGCIESWRRDHEALSMRATHLLAPLISVLGSSPCILGDAPSLADAAVFGQLHMIEFGAPGWISTHAQGLLPWWERLSARG